ncbi:hypothetical protein EMIT0P218_60278 [Pseudomonas sp. IT-P218]
MRSSRNICSDSANAFAGKPAPTGFCGECRIVIHHKPCRSWLASEEAGKGAAKLIG